MKTIQYTVEVIYLDGKRSEHWYNKKGHLHREGGPAVTNFEGDKFWYKDNLLHREGEPAIEYSSHKKEWYENGLRHNVNGPAITGYSFGSGDPYEEYWLNGHQLNKEDWQDQSKPNWEIIKDFYQLIKVSSSNLADSIDHLSAKHNLSPETMGKILTQFIPFIDTKDPNSHRKAALDKIINNHDHI